MKENNSYRFMWGQKQSAMFAEGMLLNFAEDNEEFTITEEINDVVREHNKGFSYIYFSEESIEKGNINGKRLLDKEEVKKIFERISKTITEFKHFCKMLQMVDLKSVSKKQIIEAVKMYKRQMIFGQKMFRASDPSATNVMEEKIRKILSRHYNDKDIVKYLSVLLTSVKLDKTQQELIEWHRLLKEKEKISDEHLLKHALNYPANYANTWSYKEIVLHLREKLLKENIDEIEEEIKKLKEFKQEIKEKQEKIYAELKNEKDLKHYSETLQELAIKRFELKHCWSGAETLCLDFLKDIAKKVGIDFETFMASYNFTDVITFFEEGKRLSETEIEERKDYSILHYKEGKLIYLYGQEAREYFKNLYSLEEAKKELKGTIANKGIAKGRVRIVIVDDLAKFVEDSKEFQQGEILVTTMTSPIMVSLAKKAVAIVTNEGGICSHAAVIARELGIPCVVGTSNATMMLKTGDFVEVDADKGLIRKI
ncbi:hypothetical protein HN695_04085 [Candidatus Woesearchaeota archaeon]|jgi:rifampicin phosphotransferase|nr:hypothetical protein [Candidatus Woesearchaeota archaeon]MBT5272328.1 hypothetical protein [Candidatus Woesearchaeota archaeon]MBT6040657.1 hypothetical protein [Candidatus Woesearchaeota archaeon]MBT6336600.1 hypothetical protein [Candidatus Woesearchaeota archaeon]MBT7927490.1 hypothetical protein [Candidatus Woesearchaeota archaeon]